MKQLVTFICTNGEMENFDYGIYNKKYTDKKIIEHFYGVDDIEEDEEAWDISEQLKGETAA